MLTWKWTPKPSVITALIRRIAGDIERRVLRDLRLQGFHNGIADMIRKRIRERGTDADGRPLEPYDPDTVEFRAALGLPTGRVDLTVSGLFLDSMTGVDLPGDKIGVAFRGSHGGIGNELLGRMIIAKGRDFFGLPAADEKRAKERAREIWRGHTVPGLVRTWEGN